MEILTEIASHVQELHAHLHRKAKGRCGLESGLHFGEPGRADAVVSTHATSSKPIALSTCFVALGVRRKLSSRTTIKDVIWPA